ncbi:methyltransferase domain-containing protein [Streptomyces pacificus]|uniref:Class I SAM-dependent methyltransferase n=1 Tax=Streptomyces pacificus TaxID=2705029 RepID=A0A6A0B100_9ACTN|nr:methyltransferase domain-containing protein [Streptomyces pacificus]GFH37517.1 class I SAM-dependent methyltransferase [Streptomyces pacificus]
MSLLHNADLTAAFDRAARSYDGLVGANPGYHRQLRRSARRLGLPGAEPPDGALPGAGLPGPGPARGRGVRLLDLGCGTGASTAALLSAAPYAQVTAVDASAGMLERARRKSWPRGVSFVHARAEGLAEAGVTGPFDAVFAAYLFRNVSDPDRVLARVRGLLAPGGRIAVHEYTLSGRPAHRAVWTAVCRGLVLPVARRSGDGDLYRHLWRSVVEFDTAEEFARRLERAGFVQVRVLPLPGWHTGITHTFVARVPTAEEQA